MIREAIGTGETLQDAIEAAKAALGVGEDADVKFDVLVQPQKKTLGLFGGKDAKVRAYVESTPLDAATAYLTALLDGMKLDVSFEVKEEADGAVFTLKGEDVGHVIGHHGETLDALQYLTSLACNKGGGSYFRITLNSGNYRQKREDSLSALAKSIAAKALRNQRNYTLEPMNPYERRIIHTAVMEIEGVSSWSTGEDSNRRVVIGVDENNESITSFYRPSSRGGNDRRGGRRDARGNDRRGGRRDGRGGKRPAYQPSADAAREKKTEHDDIALYGRIN